MVVRWEGWEVGGGGGMPLTRGEVGVWAMGGWEAGGWRWCPVCFLKFVW